MEHEKGKSSNKYQLKKDKLGYMSSDPMPTAEYLKEFYQKVYFKDMPTITYGLDYPTDELEHKKFRAEALVSQYYKAKRNFKL